MDIRQAINRSVEVKQKILSDPGLIDAIEASAEAIISAFRAGNKVLFCGNGGSAADAQHLAAEFSGRFYYDRPPLPSEALHVNTSYLTAVANDYSYDEVYARIIRGSGRNGDVLVALSTSGNSENILRALGEAKSLGMTTIGLTGESGGRMNALCDLILRVPSADTPRIQEAHIMIGHVICERVESTLFPRE
jgi:D-sedoheptulose 7-phosphate isomerase